MVHFFAIFGAGVLIGLLLLFFPKYRRAMAAAAAEDRVMIAVTIFFLILGLAAFLYSQYELGRCRNEFSYFEMHRDKCIDLFVWLDPTDPRALLLKGP